jgi:hypothetical protein
VPTYVYGITTERDPPRLERGVAGSSVRTLSEDGLCAIVATVPDGLLEANRANLMAHSNVLQEVLQDGAVVPMRFGIVLSDDAAVRSELLAGRRDDLLSLLDAVQGKVELSLSVYYIEDAILGEIVATTPAIARLQASIRSLPDAAAYYQRIRLGELVAEELARRRVADATALVSRFVPLAVAIQEARDLPERTVLRASFLVPREGVDRFRDAVDAAAHDLVGRMLFKLVGPLPPFSFVDVEVDVPAGSTA